MVSQKYRWDFIGLSTDEKPTSATSEKVVNGSTYYCSDTSKLYVYCDGTWYERKPLGGGGGGGGTSDFNDLSNRPKYNGSDMTGSTNIPEVKTYTAGSNVAISEQNVISATDTTYSNFVGTDGTAAGTAGLVPAPATTDTGKFLKSDGTWDTAGGGGSGATELTSADYDYHTSGSTDDGVALWRLNPGMYVASGPVKVYVQNINFYSKSDGEKIYFISNADNEGKSIVEFYNSKLTRYGVDSSGNLTAMTQYCQYTDIFASSDNKNSVRIGGNSSSSAIYGTAVGFTSYAQQKGSISLGAYSRTSAAGEMNIGSTDTGYGYNSSNYRLLTGLYDGQSAHDAATVAQGNTLSTSAPTTSTVGVLGQLYTDTTNMHTYQCTAISGDTYTWTQRW